ncbi:hemerythrin domain-containing protein [Streptomyces hundungensis]|uniref:hemerythrin domain-containing protein n=1 Tax=Streptomyces hundungensis TaxID=1077946 RepID=UPI0033C16DBB
MSSQRDLLDQLTAEHRAVEVLFGEMAGLPLGDPQRKEFLDEASRALVRHAAAEERHLHPLVRRLPNGDELIERDRADHSTIEALLGALRACSVESQDFNRLVAQLDERTTRHMSAEEAQIFPALRETVNPTELLALGDEVRSTEAAEPAVPRPQPPSALPPDDLRPPQRSLRERVRGFFNS